ncbi:hypothetical protein AVKW3434_16510 [Acidovorax sp. SUPP3434]|uniref:PIN domain-containing protein n=1 Tax=Acidovorax sp. SUPP3434 TaxID=2920880 RepID=UPI0023DE378D|nr:PIN domain-containing protein [Acidovorax sp. SUPP3434]GKT01013.1 hypothetical protein AVKW3434_16510 [Acidovorax sp. SUPP3434]
MTFSSCLVEQSNPLVLDASVVINLLATGHAGMILQSLPGRSYVTENVVGEINGGAGSGRPESKQLFDLIEGGPLEVAVLDELALESFIDIVSGSASESLGDGEAATLAFAYHSGLTAAIDERKATRIASERFASLRMATTVDILAHSSVMHALGQERLSMAVLDALRLARMQVGLPQFEWVVEQIGVENLALCPSLRRLVKNLPASGRCLTPSGVFAPPA